jgi:GT2 family glycosyltransferase
MLEVTVVMAVLGRPRQTGQLLHALSEQTRRPKKIVFVDNTELGSFRPLVEMFPSLNISYLPMGKNIGLNAAWNLGLEECETEIIAQMNNDITIPSWLVESALSTFGDSQVGIAVGEKAKTSGLVAAAVPPEYVVPQAYHKGRDGWCFFIRTRVAQEIGPVPETLFNFFGDDWYFNGCRHLGFKTVRLLGVPVYHEIGVSRQRPEDLVGIPSLKEEEQEWIKLMSQ